MIQLAATDVRSLRRASTTSEDMLWSVVRNRRLGAKFRRQQKIDRFVADFYCASSRLAVEIDGAVHDERADADRERDACFAAHGIKVLRVTADEVERDAIAIGERIRAQLEGVLPLSTKLERGPGGEVSRRPRGFTLLEIGIALVLLGLMIAVAVPSLDAVTGARLKESVNTIGGAIRDTYARTALLGRSTRLVLDLEQQAWWVEESEGVARVKPMKLLADREGKVALDAKDERIADIDEGTTDLKEQAKVQILTGPAFKPVEGEWGQPQKLPADVRFKSVWIEHLDDKVGHGVAALYFYPGGHTEEALITLTDAAVGDDDPQGGDTMTLEVAGLTGEVYVVNDEPRVPTLEEDN